MTPVVIVLAAAVVALVVGTAAVAVSRRRRRLHAEVAAVAAVMRRLMAGHGDARVDDAALIDLREVGVALNDLAVSGEDAARREEERRALAGVLLSVNRQIRAELDFDAIALGTALTMRDELAVDHVWLRVFSDALNPDGFVVTVPDTDDGALPEPLGRLFQRTSVAFWAEGRVARLPDTEGRRSLIGPDDELGIWLELAPRGVDTLLVVPLGAGDEVLGYMLLGRGPSAPRWTDAEMEAAGEAGAAVGQALANVRIIAREYRVSVEMREIDRQKTELVSNVSHELRTPLTAIEGYVEMLRDGDYGDLPPDVDDVLEIVERGATRLRELIENLLVLSRSESPAVGRVRSRVDLRGVIDDAVTLLTPEAVAGSVALRSDLGRMPVHVVGDPTALERAVLNVVSNAVKFTPAGGRVVVSLVVRGALAVVVVADSGIGIGADEQARVFDRFYRAPNASGRGIRGTGLGLAITRSILEDHGGAVRLASVEGQGTTVELTIRVASPAE